MLGVWEVMRQNEEDESVVVIPSVSVDRINERSGSLQQAYEGRLLVLLLLLRQPRLRIIYVTSMPIAPKIVEYYLALLTEVIPSALTTNVHRVTRLWSWGVPSVAGVRCGCGRVRGAGRRGRRGGGRWRCASAGRRAGGGPGRCGSGGLSRPW